MTLNGSDNRTIISNQNSILPPYNSVVGVDSIIKTEFSSSNPTYGIGVGSGIIVGSNHVLTAAHVVSSDIDRSLLQNGRVLFSEDLISAQPRGVTPIAQEEYNVEVPNDNADIYPIRNVGYVGAEDVGVLKLKESAPDLTNRALGLITYVNPNNEDLVGIEVATAGYPASVSSSDLDESSNAQFRTVDNSKNIAVDKSFTVDVTDGSLDLDFLASLDNAKVSAIEIKLSVI